MPTIKYASAVFAIAAAMLWFVSAVVKTPKSFSLHVARADSLHGKLLAGSVFGSEYVGHGHSPELTALGAAMSRQSMWSAAAAVCAGIAAALQAVSDFG